MEVIFRSPVPNNIEYWKVYNDDSQIIHFLHSMKEFSDNQVNFLVESMILRVEDFPNDTLHNIVSTL
jgi:hypothetical protein